jgi:HK97 family phage prohead protease
MPQSPFQQTAEVKLELKALKKTGHFEGYASVYGNVDRGYDVVEAGAFDKSLAEIKRGDRKPKMLFMHDVREIVGKWDHFEDEAKGLYVKGHLNMNVQRGAEIYHLLKDDSLEGLSIGYKTINASWETRDEEEVRLIHEAELWEVSHVTFPMNALSTVTDVKQLGGVGDVESILRDAGVPNNFAKLVARYGLPEATKRLNSDHRDGDAKNAKALQTVMAELSSLKEILHAKG